MRRPRARAWHAVARAMSGVREYDAHRVKFRYLESLDTSVPGDRHCQCSIAAGGTLFAIAIVRTGPSAPAPDIDVAHLKFFARPLAGLAHVSSAFPLV